MKKLLPGILLIFTTGFATLLNAQVVSPESFLGYPLGAHFTPHHRLRAYFEALAKGAPDRMLLQNYGVTVEGRPLMKAIIASPENLKRIEDIRLNNLRLAGMADGQPSLSNAPAIIWLSYNVHGNEPSSSEAAMKTAYSLLDPANEKAKAWLANTVIIIDPCVNPDGRDRYVNWYNSVAGTEPNPDPQDIIHNGEPWPGGRVNHYHFDLNRDWAWQTQPETQARMKEYNSWLPQVHVDYHEQGYNNPYYFAPAAEPFHDVITPWQRGFQEMIGRNNASYFDRNGWLYFTKEEFDLFYPSYGDTYPIYNGAIGMTFEQGGHNRAGLAVAQSDGDTLTLADRVLHHYTTAMSTIEVSSREADRLLKEYRLFFQNNISGKGDPYKTYVFTDRDPNKLRELAKLFDRNGISYGSVKGNFSGFDYFIGSETAYHDDGYQLAVTSCQPKGSLLKVLTEPLSRMSDSVTYDITAWSLPYVYGIHTYAVKERLPIAEKQSWPEGTQPASTGYGVLIPYNSFASAKAMAWLLNRKVRLRFAEKPFTYKGREYQPGTMIALRGNQADWAALVNEACRTFRLEARPVESGFMDKGADFGSTAIRYIEAPKVAMITGEQTSATDEGEVWSLFDRDLQYPIARISAANLNRTNLGKYDVLILPDGNYRFLSEKSSVEHVREFVRSGGKLIAVQNAMTQLTDGDWGLKKKEAPKPSDKDSAYASLRRYGDRERDEVRESVPGAIFRVELDNSHPLAFGYGANYYTLRQSAVNYEFLKDGWNVGVLKKNGYTAGFVGSRVKNTQKDGLIFGVQDFGRGQLVLMADDPLFRHFWENGKLLFANAVFLVGQ